MHRQVTFPARQAAARRALLAAYENIELASLISHVKTGESNIAAHQEMQPPCLLHMKKATAERSSHLTSMLTQDKDTFNKEERAANMSEVNKIYNAGLGTLSDNHGFEYKWDATGNKYVEPAFEVYKMMAIVRKKWQCLVDVACRKGDAR